MDKMDKSLLYGCLLNIVACQSQLIDLLNCMNVDVSDYAPYSLALRCAIHDFVDFITNYEN